MKGVCGNPHQTKSGKNNKEKLHEKISLGRVLRVQCKGVFVLWPQISGGYFCLVSVIIIRD